MVDRDRVGGERTDVERDENKAGPRGGYRRGGRGSRGRGQGSNRQFRNELEREDRGEAGRTDIMEMVGSRAEYEGRGGYRGRGQNRREGGERSDRGKGRKVRDVKGDPNFWVKNGVVGDENGTHVTEKMSTLVERENGKSSGSKSEKGFRGRGPKRKNIIRTDDDVDLRDRLADQLERGMTECMVCLDRVRQMHPTWDCHNCYQVSRGGCSFGFISFILFPDISFWLHQEVGQNGHCRRRRMEVPWLSSGGGHLAQGLQVLL